MHANPSLLRAAVVYTLTNILAAAVPFALLPLLTRTLTPNEYGQVAMFSVAITFFGAFVGLNVHGAVGIRYFEKSRLELSNYVAACLVITASSALMTVLIVGLLLPSAISVAKLPGEWILAAIGIAACLSIVQTRLAIWQSAGKPWPYGALRLVQSTLDASLSLWLVLAIGMGWEGRALGLSVAAALVAGIALLLLLRFGWARLPVRRADLANALHFGVPLIPHVIGGMLIAMVDRVMISDILGVTSTGIYLVALQIGMILGLLTDSFNRAYAPWLFRMLTRKESSKDTLIVRLTWAYFAAVTLVAIFLGLSAPSLLAVLVGEKFRGAAPLVVYIALGFAFGGMYYMVTNYIFFAGRTARLAVLTLSCGTINVALSYWLLHRNGLAGAAQAFMVAQALLFLSTWWLANKSHPMPWLRAMMPGRAS